MSILKSRQFLPLFVTQFMGAFNDSMFKNALVVLITYRFATHSSIQPQILVALTGAIFILPFFLFSATAGQLADKYDRAKIARIVKVAELALMGLAVAGLFMPSLTLLLVVLFGMGMHSTFFGPVKYAILPQHLEGKDLLKGNAYVEAATFLSILLGTVLGGIFAGMGVTPGEVMAAADVVAPLAAPETPAATAPLAVAPVTQESGTLGLWLLSALMCAVAVIGYFTSRFIPAAPGPEPELKVNKNFWTETLKIMEMLLNDVGVYRAILAISWFWLAGATYLTQFPTFAKDYLHGDPSVATLLLTLFSIGIGVGSILCNKLLRGQVQATYVPLAAIGMAIFGVDLYFATKATATPEGLISAATFLAAAANWRTMFDLFMIALCGGIFVVPLYALVQKRSDPAYLARMIAGLNIMNSLFMVASSVFTAILLKMNLTIPQIFLAMALANILVAIYIVQLLPDALFRSLTRAVFTVLYKTEVRGLENFNAGGKMLIIANHTSFLDAALIAAYLPVPITFAINTQIAQAWWIKPFLKLVDAFPVDPTNPMALKGLIEVVKSGKIGMIFPEGRITVTGSLMKVYEGPGLIADKAKAKILPIRIEGAQYSRLSRLRGKAKLRAFPKITLTILPPCDFGLPEGVFGRKRRQLAAAQLYDTMSSMVFEASELDKTLFQSLMEARRVHGGNHICAEDPQRQPVNYRNFIARSMVLGKLMAKEVETAAEIPAVGVLLPNMIGTSMVFFGLHSARKVPAMLNFSVGPAQIASACQTAMIKTVVTSRRFIEMGKMDATVAAINDAGVKLLYLEDLRAKAGIGHKLYGLVAMAIPEFLDLLKKKTSPNAPGVILFTSGSEGAPKGVVLSHRNIQANRHQVASRVDFGPSDIVFNCLPMFHSFGLTGGTLLPILGGLRAFYYPSPLHYRIVPELIYDTNATILFGTDTFLSGYSRFAHPYDFHAIRYVFAGAEKLKEETRKVYAEKYGVRIFEGYGSTETAPVISINTPMHNRPGSVGRLLPGITGTLEPVEGLESDTGKLIVKGPNVMLGYLKSDAPGVLQPPDDGWYDTGDIVRIDGDGFVSIQGRLKRFAKIAGEMVSLTAVEGALQKLWPEKNHAVISVRDEKKGEKLILFTTQPGATSADILQHFRKLGLGELSVPKQIETVAEIPVLGTGKTDYMSLKKRAEG